MNKPKSKPNLGALLKPYKKQIILLVVLAFFANAINLALPKLIARAIDAYGAGTFQMYNTVIIFVSVSVAVFIFATLQSIAQVYVSERAARDLRNQVTAKISRQSYLFIQRASSAKLLTNITADVDSIKLYISQAVVSIVSSLVLIVGASILLLITNWRLACVVLIIIPLIGGTFFVVFSRVRKLFIQGREALDWLNKVINESILGAALIRVIHSQHLEAKKFSAANTESKRIGMQVLKLFAMMIPTITFISSLGTLTILALGGHFVIQGSMTIGQIAAFNSYIAMLIFPILVLGFMSNVIAQASASYERIMEVIDAPESPASGFAAGPLSGAIEVKNVNLAYGEKSVLKDASFSIKAGTRTAIIGPTAAGKTQLLYLLTGLIIPDSGTILYDGQPLAAYSADTLHESIASVFQDSALFNMSVRENIAFSEVVTPKNLERAIDAAELVDFVHALPNGLETVVSERGTSLSGGQKQRIMLARALALDPKILILDDFTARVDSSTERKILAHLADEYRGLTLISVTQKIGPVEDFDQIIVLMEGEVLAIGTHAELLKTSPEYVQIFNSQQSTNQYELRA